MMSFFSYRKVNHRNNLFECKLYVNKCDPMKKKCVITVYYIENKTVFKLM